MIAINKEIKIQYEKLKREVISLRETEKEIAYREKRKDVAFNLLEKAQDFVSKGNFDDAIQMYYSVANIFAQIQWTEEIPIIQETIHSIENKKRQNELNKQRLLKKAIRRETEERAFIERIK